MSQEAAEPFPALSPANTEVRAQFDGSNDRIPPLEPVRTSNASPARRTRGASLLQSFVNSNPPLGMWQATGEVGSKIPTLPEIRNGSFATEGWSHEGQMETRGTNPHEIHRRRLARTSSASARTRKSSLSAGTPTPAITEETHEFFPRRASTSTKEPLNVEGAMEQIPTQKSIHHPTVSTISEKADMTESTRGPASPSSSEPEAARTHTGPDKTGTYPNGYRFPKKHTWTQSTVIGLKAFWKFVLTPFGFVITIYGLNVVGWGAMIFFVLLNAAPAMCHPSCNDLYSARKIWIEIDSQVLNALFCVTGFGLIPWRFRDFYYLMRWRVWKSQDAHRRLAGIYRGWYRLPGSDQLAEDIGPPPTYSKKKPRPESPPPYTPEELHLMEANPAIPLPPTSMPEPPLTGMRAAPSRSWTLDIVIWMYLLNTAFQTCLAAFMWALNRFNRPSWATGLFITLGCLTGIFAGIVVFIEGSKVKKAEGIPVQEYDVLESVEDYQERKAKEDAKEMKKQHSHEKHHSRKVISSEKLKGEHWFTRH